MHTLRPVLALRSQQGSVLLAALFIAMVVAGLAFGLLTEGFAARANMIRSDTTMRALELAEAGVLRAELELANRTVSTLTLQGAFGNGTYVTTVRDLASEVAYRQGHQPDPLPIPSDMTGSNAADLYRNRYWVVSTGRVGQGTRTVETHLRRWPAGLYREGLFAIYNLQFGGNSTTDAYSSLDASGAVVSYASQLAAGGNMDSRGRMYVETGGDIGSNLGMITLTGSSTSVRGNAIPGSNQYVDLRGPVEVTGDMTPRTQTRTITTPTAAEFTNALTIATGGAMAPNGTQQPQHTRWNADGAVNYNIAAMTLALGNNRTLTLRGGTSAATAVPYFFTSLTVGSNSTLAVQPGEYVKIYITQSFTMAGNSTLQNTGSPRQLEIVAHPHSGMPTGSYPVPSQMMVRLTGGVASAMSLYAPEFPFEIHGGSELFGAAVARTITASGGVNFHYDKSLGDLRTDPTSSVERVYWAEPAPPRR